MSAMWPKPLLVAFERGYNALVGVRPIDITAWHEFKQVCRQLEKPEAKEMYETVVIDTVAIAYALCEKYILNREAVNNIAEIPYGKGWGMLKDEFETTFRKLTQMGYSIVFIAHSKTRKTEYTDEEGNEIEALAPDLTNAAYQIINRMVDVIGYIGVEYDKNGLSSRYLYTRGTPRIFAGSRYKYLTPKIPLGYQELVDAIAAAMEKEASLTGTRLITEDELPMPQMGPTFDELLEQARIQWNRVLKVKGSEEGRAILRKIVVETFGSDIQLSKTPPEQADLLEQAIQKMTTIQ